MAIELTAEVRNEFGKEVNKRARKAGRLPGNIYGQGFDKPVAISFDLKETETLVREHGRKTEYLVKFSGKSYPARLGELQRHPLRKGFVHIEFIAQAGGAN
jgi:large subunit ribosomal protein L25